MPIPIELRRKVEEALKLIEEGRESYESIARRFGIGKATVFRWHIEGLSKEVEQRTKALVELEGKLKALRSEYETIEAKYKEKREALENDYEKRHEELEGAIEKLKQDAEAVKAFFENQGLSWEEGVAIVKNIASLREELKTLKSEIPKLKSEASNWQTRVNGARLALHHLEKEEKRLREAVSNMRLGYLSYMNWFKAEAPKLEQYKSQLQESIKTLEGQALSVREEIDKLQKERAEASASLRAVEAEKENIKGKIGRLRTEVEGLTERMIRDAEERRAKILNEVEGLQREKEKLKAEKDFLEHAIKDMLKQLQHAKENRKVKWQIQAQKDNASPLQSLIERLPTLPLLRMRQTRGTRTISTNSN
jgi:chromosome segregation ATPase